MPSVVVPHCRPCLLVWCLTIGHACWCGTSLSAMSVVVVPQYRPCLLAWYLNIGHACWAVAIVQPIFYWEKDGYKSGATCTEVPLHQICLLIRRYSHICLLVQCNSNQTCIPGSFIQMRIFVVLLHQARHLVC